MSAALAVTTTALAPRALNGPMIWAPPADLPVRLASDSGRVMERAVLRPIDLTRTHGVNVRMEDLVEMARVYSPQFEAGALNFDHSQGGPAHGLASKLWIAGELLWCRMEQLSDEAIAALSSGQWPRCSSEFWTNHPVSKSWYWCGLALLGVRPPAVPGLPAPVFMSTRRVHRMDAGEISPARRLELRLRYPDAYAEKPSSAGAVLPEYQEPPAKLAAECEALRKERDAERAAMARESGVPVPKRRSLEQERFDRRLGITEQRRAELRHKYSGAYSEPTPPRGGKAA